MLQYCLSPAPQQERPSDHLLAPYRGNTGPVTGRLKLCGRCKLMQVRSRMPVSVALQTGRASHTLVWCYLAGGEPRHAYSGSFSAARWLACSCVPPGGSVLLREESRRSGLCSGLAGGLVSKGDSSQEALPGCAGGGAASGCPSELATYCSSGSKICAAAVPE
jgi:hypothetical protein